LHAATQAASIIRAKKSLIKHLREVQEAVGEENISMNVSYVINRIIDSYETSLINCLKRFKFLVENPFINCGPNLGRI